MRTISMFRVCYPAGTPSSQWDYRRCFCNDYSFVIESIYFLVYLLMHAKSKRSSSSIWSHVRKVQSSLDSKDRKWVKKICSWNFIHRCSSGGSWIHSSKVAAACFSIRDGVSVMCRLKTTSDLYFVNPLPFLALRFLLPSQDIAQFSHTWWIDPVYLMSYFLSFAGLRQKRSNSGLNPLTESWEALVSILFYLYIPIAYIYGNSQINNSLCMIYTDDTHTASIKIIGKANCCQSKLQT